MTTEPTKAGLHGYQSACDPAVIVQSYDTFSISFFQWEQGKKKPKKGKSFFRLVAPTCMRDAAFLEAQRIVGELDGGWKPTKKQWTIK